ncbi:two-component regulator propeller domain-containing protein [Pedobacter antarcticus]|uniref:ligand-binding sensor domain-containing protein n=1 Tax=Pedobacter antarcticus TaxID=34086 RepID=UPI0029309B1F|nr:two-component regulator propeller domain-containing protein [Pedobacter antarcticus]
MKNLLTIFISLLSIFTGNVFAQPYYFRHYRVEDGLSNNTVFTVMQDQRGFVWFGSKEGLNRFDGNSFKTYNDRRFPENIRGFILHMARAEKGYIWIGTRRGVYRFDEQKETFSAIGLLPDLEIDEIKMDENGRLWVLAGRKLYRYDDKKGKVQKFNLPADPDIASFTSAGGAIWACTTSGYIYKCLLSSNNFSCQNQGNPLPHNNLNRVIKIYFVDNTLFIGSTTGLVNFNINAKTYHQIIDPNTLGYPVFVRDILRYSKDEFWVATETGIFIYNQTNGHLTHLKQNYSDPYSLSDNAVYSLMKDQEGGIWATTYFGGVNYFHPQQSKFKKYFANSSVNPISGNGVREICSDDFGNLWIGTEDAGLNKLNKRTGEISSFRSIPKVKGISSDNIHGLMAVGRELWIGTFERGLDILDIPTGKVIRHYSAEDPASGLSTNFIISICKTKNNEIYLGTNKGLYLYKPATRTFLLVPQLPSDVYISSLFEDEKGTLWIGTIGRGVFYYNSDSNNGGNLKHNPNDKNSLSNNMISDVFQDSNRDYWFATENGGLNYLSQDRKKFRVFTTQDGLPSNLILKVLEDETKNLWITTSKGLVRYNRQNNSWVIFTKPHGLLTDQFNYNSAFNDHGTFYMGTVSGLISFKPDDLNPTLVVPPVYITSFHVDNQELRIDSSTLKKSITFTDTVELSYNQSSFSIGFAALAYTAPQVTQYAYIMEGLDNQWTYLKNNRHVYFTKLSPGTYTFRVKSTGYQESKGLEQKLVIVIRNPYWFSIYAFILYTIMIVCIVYWAISTYHRKIRLKNRRRLEQLELAKEKEIYQAKIEFFTNVAHEIRTPLTLIKGPLETVMDEVSEIKSVQKNLKSIERNTERLLSLTNQLLDFRKTEHNGLSLSYVRADVSKLIVKITNSYSSIAKEKGISFQVLLQEKHLFAFIDIEAFTKIVDNLVSNAIKYADSKVLIEMFTVNGNSTTFSIKISNDGFIIPVSLKEKIFESFYRIPATEHLSGSGIGLSLARSLTELHGGSLLLAESELPYNVFVLTLPVHQNVEFNLPHLKKIL